MSVARAYRSNIHDACDFEGDIGQINHPTYNQFVQYDPSDDTYYWWPSDSSSGMEYITDPQEIEVVARRSMQQCYGHQWLEGDIVDFQDPNVTSPEMRYVIERIWIHGSITGAVEGRNVDPHYYLYGVAWGSTEQRHGKDVKLIESVFVRSGGKLDIPLCPQDPSRFDGLTGYFWDFRYDDPDSEALPPRGNPVHMRGSAGDGQAQYDDTHVWYAPAFIGGDDALSRSNFDALAKLASDLDNDPEDVPDDCRPWWVVAGGNHYFHIERAPESIVEYMDMNIIDEDLWSEYEQEEQSEAWENWGMDEYRRALVDRYEKLLAGKYQDDLDVDLDEVDDDVLSTHFYMNADKAGEYWENTSEGASINIDRVADYVASDGDVMDLPEGTKITGTRKSKGDQSMDFFFPPHRLMKPRSNGGGFLGLSSWEPPRRRRRR